MRGRLERDRREPRSRLPEAPARRSDGDTQGVLVRRCFRLLNAKDLGLTITLSDLTEEEFRALELIDSEKRELGAAEDKDAKSFQELLIRKLSRK